MPAFEWLFDLSLLTKSAVALSSGSPAASISWSPALSAVPANMAQAPDTIRYTFSACAPIQPGIVTILPYAAPAAPDVDHGAKLTVTRRFYDEYIVR